MANRFPLILDTTDSNKIKELPSGDNLDLTGSGISAVDAITSSSTITSKDIKITGYTTSERDALSTTQGHLIFNTTIDKFQGYAGSAWQTFQGIDYTDISVTTGAASGGGLLSYNSSTGVFTFNPAATTAQSLSLVGTNLAISGGNTISVASLQGATTFPALTDTPTDYSGSENAFVKVNAAGNGLEFVANPGYITGVTFAQIQSKPTTLSGFGITDGQATLVSGTNIKTINGTSILGSGNINIAGGSGGTGILEGQTYDINITGDVIADDSTVMVNTATKSITAGGGITGDVTGSIFANDSTLLVDGNNSTFPGITGNDLDMGGNKVLFANVYSNLVDLPNASTYHGMFAHVHATGKGYFAHGGNWIPLVDETTVNGTIDAHLNTSSASADQILSWNGSDYVWKQDQTGTGGGAQSTESEEYSWKVGADDSVARVVDNGEQINILGGSGITTASDAEGNITITASAGSGTGNVTFSGTTIDSSDSSGIVFTPTVTTSSDLIVQNDIRCSNVVYAESFQSTGTGVPAFTSNSSITLSAVDRINITRGPINQADFTTVERDALSSVNGDLIYNTTDNAFQGYANGSWTTLTGGGSGDITRVNITAGTGLSGTQDTTSGDHTQTLNVDASQTQITAIGTIATGVWQGTAIADGYISSAATWNAKIANVADDTTPQLGGDLDVNGKTIAHTFVLGASGSDHYTFSDAGNIWFPTTENDPVIYLRRGEQYIFTNSSGGSHPFEIRVSNGGSAYNTGVTNNGASSGNIIFKVPMSAPATLYYQCTSHSLMGNTINIV